MCFWTDFHAGADRCALCGSAAKRPSCNSILNSPLQMIMTLLKLRKTRESKRMRLSCLASTSKEVADRDARREKERPPALRKFILTGLKDVHVHFLGKRLPISSPSPRLACSARWLHCGQLQ